MPALPTRDFWIIVAGATALFVFGHAAFLIAYSQISGHILNEFLPSGFDDLGMIAATMINLGILSLIYWRLGVLFGYPLRFLAIHEPSLSSFVQSAAYTLAITSVFSYASYFYSDGLFYELSDFLYSSFPTIGYFSTFLVVLYVVFLGPVAEEALFRGIIFRYLFEKIGGTYSAVLSSLAFALAHTYIFIGSAAGLVLTLEVFAFGLFLCWLYYREGNLAICMWAHGLNNALFLLVAEYY